MTLNTPLWEENATYTATQDRELIDGLFQSTGVLSATDLVVAQCAAGANMSVDVAAGRVVIAGTDIASQAKYFCWNDAPYNVPLAPAPGAGETRISLIVATVLDSDAIGGSSNDWIIQEVEGTATTGTPAAPAVPSSSELLATIPIPSGTATILDADITDGREFAALVAVEPDQQVGSITSHTLSADTGTATVSNLTIEQAGWYDIDAFIAVDGSSASPSGAYVMTLNYLSGAPPTSADPALGGVVMDMTDIGITFGFVYRSILKFSVPLYCNIGDQLNLTYQNLTPSSAEFGTVGSFTATWKHL